MEPRSESISEVLLSRLPRPANITAYKDELKSHLSENETRLRRNKWTVVRVWVFVAIVSAPFLWLAATHFNTPQGNWFLGLVCFWVLFGAIEVSKYIANKHRVELLKEIKQVQLQILELYAFVSKGQ